MKRKCEIKIAKTRNFGRKERMNGKCETTLTNRTRTKHKEKTRRLIT